MTSYRVSTSELEKLKKQLEDLLEKKFVQPSALKENHLYAKFFRMRVMVKGSEFPWSYDSSGGIVVDLSNIDDVLQWETLNIVVNSIDSKGLSLCWDVHCEKSFQELKKKLMFAPILISMDPSESFVVYCDASKMGLGDLPKTSKGCDSIWVIVYRLTKSAHFVPMMINYPLQKLDELYIAEAVKLNGNPSSIVSDRDLRFTSRFWESL
ncbi:uncharacterized protein LOC127091898 [Lathyrus oleraceus]|uniref:uncharacterized protein LOC127091898 n=1 Tax=Pisum sativum TaxID=3888 RepID=UPI0021D099C4|nr:uncharacterized protein LOC127091898 [Pisum sativum]